MWSDELDLAAGALALAGRYMRAAATQEPGEAALLVEQAEGEIERAGRFMERARQELAHAA